MKVLDYLLVCGLYMYYIAHIRLQIHSHMLVDASNGEEENNIRIVQYEDNDGEAQQPMLSVASSSMQLHIIMDTNKLIDDGKKRCKPDLIADGDCWDYLSNVTDAIRKGVNKIMKINNDNDLANQDVSLLIYSYACSTDGSDADLVFNSLLKDVSSASITDVFSKLKKGKLSGGSCPSSGIRSARAQIEDANKIGGKKSHLVLLFTHGVIAVDFSEKDKAKSEASMLTSIPGVTLYSMATTLKTTIIKQQRQALLAMYNDESKIITVDRIELLSPFLSIATAALGNSFDVSFAYSNQLQQAIPYGGNGIDQICLGATTIVNIIGNSIQYLSRESIQCNFFLPLLPAKSVLDGERQSIVNAILDPDTGYRSCELPGTFMRNHGGKVILQLSVLDTDGYRLIGSQIPLPSILMIPCASSSLVNQQDRCIIGGGNTTIAFSGPSVVYALPRLSSSFTSSSLLYPLICIFTRATLKVTRPAFVSPANQQQIYCSIDSDDDLKSLLQAKLYPSPILSVSFAAGDINWMTIEKTLNPAGDFPIGLISSSTISNAGTYPDAVSNGCIAFLGLSDSSTCWTGLTDDSKNPSAYFTGKSITLLNKYINQYRANSKFGFQCAYTKGGLGIVSVNATLALDTNSQPLLRCPIPSILLQTTNGVDIISNFKIAINIMQTSDGLLTLISNNPSSGFKASILVKSCFTTIFTNKNCIGNEQEFNITGEGISQITSNADLACQFDDSTRSISFISTVRRIGSNLVSCKQPALVGQYSGVFFDTLILRDKALNGKLYYKMKDISFNLELCFNFEPRYFPNGNNFCWSYDNTASATTTPSIAIKGTSVKYISTSKDKITLIFYDEFMKQEYVVSPIYQILDNNNGEFIASVPPSITKRPIGSAKITATLMIGTNAVAVTSQLINIIACSKIEQIYIPSVNDENPGGIGCWPYCCYRNSVDVQITGSNYAALVNDSNALCQFSKSNIDGTTTFVASSKLVSNGPSSAKCSAPGWTPFQDAVYPLGVYSSVSVIIQSTRTTPKYEIVQSPILAPSQVCASYSYNKNLKWGQPLQISVRGTSLFSFALWGMREKVNWLDLLKCSLIDMKSKTFKNEYLPITWDKNSGTLSCQRPGTFDADEFKSTALRMVLQKPIATARRRSLQTAYDIILVDDLVVDVNFQSPFSFNGGSVSCLSNGSNIAKVIVSGGGSSIDTFGTFKCTFSDDQGKNIYSSGIDYKVSLDGTLICSKVIPPNRSVSKYSVSFESTTKLGKIAISSGTLDTSQSCFLFSSAPSATPTGKPTQSPTVYLTPSPTPQSTPAPSTILPILDAAKTVSPTSSSTSSGSGNKDNNGFGIAAIIGAIFAFIILITIAVVYHRRRKRVLRSLNGQNKDKSRQEQGNDLECAKREGELVFESTVSDDEMVYKLGDRVEVLIDVAAEKVLANDNTSTVDQEEKWMKGKVVGVSPDINGEGAYFYTISYDPEMLRPNPDRQISASQMRKMKTDYRIGYLIDCLSEETGVWERGSIINIKPNDQYTVALAAPNKVTGDQRVEFNVDGESRLRKFNPKFKVGDPVETIISDIWKRGTVKEVVGSDLYEVVIEHDNFQESIKDIEEKPTTNKEKLALMAATDDLRKYKLLVGDQVEILKGRVWLYGEVMKARRDNQYDILVFPNTNGSYLETKISISRLRKKQRYCSHLVGDIVEVLQLDDTTWKRAQIVYHLGPELYNVTYNIGRIRSMVLDDIEIINSASDVHAWNEIPSSRIRLPSFNIGDLVEAKKLDGWIEKGGWSRAHITMINDDGTFDIAFIDSPDLTRNVSQDQIKRVMCGYRFGDHIEYYEREQWRDGVILKVLANEMYLIRNTHFGSETTIPESCMRWPDYCIGDSVMVLVDKMKRTSSNFQISPADITEVDQESRVVSIRYENLSVESGVPFSRIKKYLSIEESKTVVEEAMTSGFRPPPREHLFEDDVNDESCEMIDVNLRYQRYPPVAAKFYMGNRYSVTVAKEYGLGVSLGWTNEQRIVVNNFKDLKNGDWGPLEACGLVGLKDQLLEVNGHDVDGLSFNDVAALINSSPSLVTLTFRRATQQMLSVLLQ